MKLSILFTFYFLLFTSAYALDISNRYRSPRNPERKIRRTTELIILHTTEAPAKSSLNKVSDRGECHYCITEEGTIYAIVDRDRVAFHAGRSMWRGKEDVDNFSVGIECVGYHDKAMPSVQLTAIAQLVKELQVMYRISDDCVIAHSHVAYGAPNKWHRTKHRGRKRCGMLFAMPSIRQRLGLTSRPGYDPDVKARRLVQADAYLAKVLYGKVDTMRGTTAPAPAASGISRMFGWLTNSKANAPATPPATSTTSSATTASAKPATTAASPPPRTTVAASKPKSISELVSAGYKQVGVITKGVGAMKIAGKRWNAADTYYTIRNKVVPGNAIDEAHIEKGMGVWVKPPLAQSR